MNYKIGRYCDKIGGSKILSQVNFVSFQCGGFVAFCSLLGFYVLQVILHMVIVMHHLYVDVAFVLIGLNFAKQFF